MAVALDPVTCENKALTEPWAGPIDQWPPKAKNLSLVTTVLITHPNN